MFAIYTDIELNNKKKEYNLLVLSHDEHILNYANTLLQIQFDEKIF